MKASGVTAFAAFGFAIWLAFPGAVAAADASSDSLVKAKELYQAASYDEALALLDGLQGAMTGGNLAEVEEYRLFCLLALDRHDDAQKAIEAMVAANPTYQLSESQVSPRVRTVFRDTRRALLPGIVNRAYADAKAAFERKESGAAAQFDRVLLLLNDPDLQDSPTISDMRTVVSGFRDLSAALTATKPPAAERPAPEASTDKPVPEASKPVAAIATAAPRIVPPVVLSRPLPTWPTAMNTRELTGVLEVLVDRSGNVASLKIQQSFHPQYDGELLRMARTWKFEPATLNGVPTEAWKVFNIRILPPQ